MVLKKYKITKKIFEYSTQRKVPISPDNCQRCIFCCPTVHNAGTIRCNHNEPKTKQDSNKKWLCCSFENVTDNIIGWVQKAKKHNEKTITPSDIEIVTQFTENQISSVFELLEKENVVVKL